MGAEEFLNIEEEHKREFSELLQYCLASGRIDQNLYQEYDVKRGLRDSSRKRCTDRSDRDLGRCRLYV